MVRHFIKNRLKIARSNMVSDWTKLKEFDFVSATILLLGTLVSTGVSFAAIYGTWTIIVGENPVPSATESIWLALLSAALAAVILLLVKQRPPSADSKPNEDNTIQRSQTAEMLGKSFIVAAMAFALFGLLCPFLGAVSQGGRFFPDTTFGDFSEVCVKWVALISLMIGTVTLAMPLSFGPFLFVSDILRKKRRDR